MENEKLTRTEYKNNYARAHYRRYLLQLDKELAERLDAALKDSGITVTELFRRAALELVDSSGDKA